LYKAPHPQLSDKDSIFPTMIIDAKSVIITLIVVLVALTQGIKLIRKFALQIAQENHDAIAAMDQADEQKARKREREADAAASAAFAKVESALPSLAVVPASVVADV
jgi:hypothetical protein